MTKHKKLEVKTCYGVILIIIKWLHFHSFFLLQDLCLPLYCPNNRLKINGRCVSILTKVITSTIALILEVDIRDKSTLISLQNLKPDDPNMLISRCLDFNWTYFALVAFNDIDSNVTHSLFISLNKIYSPEKEFRFLQMLASVTMCIQSTWEMSVNGQWLSLNFHFPSVQPYVQEHRTSTYNTLMESTITLSIRRSRSRRDPSYYIKKLDFCQQVG